MTTRRAAGLALIAYGLGTFFAFAPNSPGGDYSDAAVATFVSHGHMWAAFTSAYLGIFSALALLVFGLGLRDEVGSLRDAFFALTVVGATASMVGFFLSGGVAVSMAEGGVIVRSGVPHPVVYTLTETGNLLSVCAPALCVGIAGLMLVRRAELAGWLKVATVVAAGCGILAPFYFTYLVYLVWVLVFGGMLALRRAPASAPQAQTSLV
ncbi:MAG: hypothetical protein WAV00_04690 [Nocardioides sp.]